MSQQVSQSVRLQDLELLLCETESELITPCFTLLYSILVALSLLYFTFLISTLLYSTLLYSTLCNYLKVVKNWRSDFCTQEPLLYSTQFYPILLYSTLPFSTFLYSSLLYFFLIYPTLNLALIKCAPFYYTCIPLSLIYFTLFLFYSPILNSTLLHFILLYSCLKVVLRNSIPFCPISLHSTPLCYCGGLASPYPGARSSTKINLDSLLTLSTLDLTCQLSIYSESNLRTSFYVLHQLFNYHKPILHN